MKILLVNPWIHDFAAFDLWSVPMGLLIISSFLKSSGIETKLIDLTDVFFDENFLGENPAKSPKRKMGKGHYEKTEIEKPEFLKWFKRRFKRYGVQKEKAIRAFEITRRDFKPDFIMVSIRMTYWYTGGIETVETIKEIFPGVPIIAGGTYITLLPEHAKNHLKADFFIVGEIEKNIKTLSRILGKELSNPPSYTPDLSLYRKRDFIPVITSKGCPFRCSYCASPLLFRFQEFDIQNAFEYMLTNSEKFGISDIAFYDDAFLFNRERAKKFLKMISESKKSFNLHFPNALHGRFIDEEIAFLMKSAGAKSIFIGLESAEEKFQKESGGKIYREEFEKSVKNLQKAGFKPHEIGVYVMAGLPFQTAESVKETIDYVFDVGAYPKIVEYSPIPQTPLWEEAKKASPFPLKEEPLFHNNTILPCRWSGFSEEDLLFLKNYIREKKSLINP